MRPGGTLEFPYPHRILVFKRPSGTQSFCDPVPATEVAGYFQTSLTGRLGLYFKQINATLGFSRHKVPRALARAPSGSIPRLHTSHYHKLSRAEPNSAIRNSPLVPLGVFRQPPALPLALKIGQGGT
jgi:hypothetical protein